MNARLRLAAGFALIVSSGVHGQVTSSRLANAIAEPGQWLTYSGSYRSERFSPLTQISVDTVATLRPVWIYQPPGVGALEGTPIVADGVMYVTSGPASVVALDLKSGRPVWEWSRPIAPTVRNLGFPRVNRGVAIFENSVFVGTLDGYLVALDAKSGVQRWIAAVENNATGHSLTAAPLAVDGKII